MKSGCEVTKNLGPPNPNYEPGNESIVDENTEARAVINEPAAKQSMEKDAETEDDGVSTALSWLYKYNLKSGQPLFEVDLTAKQVLFLDAVLGKSVPNLVRTLEFFFELAVIDGPDFERVHYNKTDVINFWHILNAFKNL